MRKKKLLYMDDNNFILNIGKALLIIGALIAIIFSVYYPTTSTSSEDNGMGMMAPIMLSPIPCSSFVLIFSFIGLALGLIGFRNNNYELAMYGSILIILTLIMPSLIMGIIAFIIFFKYGFD
jgi:hypothetical protein